MIAKGLGESSSKVHFIIRSEANSVKKVKNDIQDSLKKFRIRKIDVYEVFVWEKKDVEKLQNSGVLDFLEETKRKKFIGCVGIFSHRIEVIKYGLDLYDFDVVSTLYNPIHRLAETLFKTIEKRNLGMISIAPFATGILVDPKYDENIRKEGVEFMNVSNVFNFILSSKYVHSIVVGSKRKQHILENIDAVSRRVQLNERERNEISKKMLEFIGKDSCRMCRYCERCPKGVPIADLLKLHILATSYGYKDFVKWQFKFFEEKIRKCDSCGLCEKVCPCLLYTSPSPRDLSTSRMPSSA